MSSAQTSNQRKMLSVFTQTPVYVNRSVKSNRMQLLPVDKPPALKILFEHPLLTVINVHINTGRAGRRQMLFSRAPRAVVPPQNTQTACLIAHQLTMQPFIVPAKTHPSMCTHTHSPKQAGLRGVVCEGPYLGESFGNGAVREGPAGGCMMKTTRWVM